LIAKIKAHIENKLIIYKNNKTSELVMRKSKIQRNRKNGTKKYVMRLALIHIIVIPP
jgi:hypothetical protein